jgi:hypothetical protein
MGPGHVGVALAVKPLAPKIPVWLLLVASEFLDILFFLLVFFGVEKQSISRTDMLQGVVIIEASSIPWSHGLLMATIWSLLGAVALGLIQHNKRSAMVIGLVVFSHWLLDFIVHLPDLPLILNDSPKVGLGLWGSGVGLAASGVLELLLLVFGVSIYIIWRRNRDRRIGRETGR